MQVFPETGNTERIVDLGKGVKMSLVLYLLSVKLTHSVFQQQTLSNFLITIPLFLLLASSDPLDCVSSKVGMLKS